MPGSCAHQLVSAPAYEAGGAYMNLDRITLGGVSDSHFSPIPQRSSHHNFTTSKCLGKFALNAIGLVAGALGIIGFAKNNMPTQTDPAGAHVQVKIGLGEPGDSGNVAGGIDGVYAYDYNNAYIGRAQGGFIDVGGVLEVTVRQDTPGIQTDFLSVSATKDAPCISWISVSQYDGSPGGAWTGDIGKACGDYWYHAGGQEAGTFADPCPQDGCSWRPVCAWLDADHSADYPYGAMKFNVRAYGELSEDTVKAGEDHVCASTLWASDSGPINGKY